jgi:hypothetical protein
VLLCCWCRHRDNDPNDGANDQPIVSVSLGNSSAFGYKPLLAAESTVVLQSGDVLVWGGPQRMLEHCVRDVRLGTCPAALQPIVGNARINFTFRSAPDVLGKEDAFSSGKYWVSGPLPPRYQQHRRDDCCCCC